MKQELEQKLTQKYPSIFAQTDLPPTQSLMCFGLECGDGWYSLIDFLCKRLVSMNKENDCQAVQVKEKYGGLCFYVVSATEEQWDIIQEIEALSYYVCEKCGSMDNVQQTGGWIQTRCNKCLEDSNANINK